MSKFMFDVFSEIKSEKMIDNPSITKILGDVFKQEIIRKFGSDENFVFILNPSNGDFEIWKTRIVVSDDDVLDENFQISLSEARMIEDDFQIGEEYSEEFVIESLGRRSILNIKQNLKSKFREYTASKIVDRFKKNINTLYSAEIKHIRKGDVILFDDLNNEIVLPKKNKINGEFYRKGDRLIGIISKAELVNGKSIIEMNRNSEEFLKALLESEISEINDGLINIEKIARESGLKSKVVVSTYDDMIDPVGICVGRNGSRINSIVKELSGEKIDIINKTENISLLVTRLLKPANLNKINIKEDCVNVYLNTSEMGKAIGKNGVNIRLASKIIEEDINIINDSHKDDVIDFDIYLTEFDDEIEKWIIDEFIKAGLDTAKSVLKRDISTLESMTDLEVETIENVIEIVKSEF